MISKTTDPIPSASTKVQTTLVEIRITDSDVIGVLQTNTINADTGEVIAARRGASHIELGAGDMPKGDATTITELRTILSDKFSIDATGTVTVQPRSI